MNYLIIGIIYFAIFFYLFLMIFFNYLTSILLTNIDFVNSVLFTFLSNHIFEGVTITVIIYLASGSRAEKILDTATKIIGSAAGSTILYNNWIKGSSSSPDSEDNDKNKKENKEGNKGDKHISGNQGTNGK